MLFSTATNDLVLEYNIAHKVLICHSCRYAVQKNALSSHLLRHKVYRGERQRLLAQFSALDLPEPEEIELPPPDRTPIHRLPVIPGLRCTASPECGHLCASEKRMRRHWADLHTTRRPDHLGSSSALGLLARPAQLQTFYRGTRLRYFEVTPTDRPSAPASSGSHPPQPSRANADPHPTSFLVDRALAGPNANIATPITPVSALINLETLNYFHHYTTRTCQTLPLNHGDDRESSAYGYWVTEVVQCCLREAPLMSGLLAISARHLAVSTSDLGEKEMHLNKYELYAAEFDNMWGHTSLEQSVAPTRAERVTFGIGNRISNLLDCIKCQRRDSGPAPAGSDRTKSLCRLLRSIHGITDRRADLSLMAQCECEHAPWQPTADFQASSAPRARPASTLDEQQDIEMSDARSAPRSFLTLTRSLPYRLADIYGKPTDMRAFLVHLTAIRSLIQFVEGLEHVHKPEEVLGAVVSWIDTSDDAFFSMIKEEDTPTLLILASWVVSGIGEASKRGHWYLDGVAEHVLSLVRPCLPGGNPKVQELFDDIRSCLTKPG